MPSFEDYLGEDMLFYLRTLLRGPDGDDDGYEAIGGIVKWQVPGNWNSALRISPATITTAQVMDMRAEPINMVADAMQEFGILKTKIDMTPRMFR